MTFEEKVTELEWALEQFNTSVSYDHVKTQAAHDILFHTDRLVGYIDTWREGGNK